MKEKHRVEHLCYSHWSVSLLSSQHHRPVSVCVLIRPASVQANFVVGHQENGVRSYFHFSVLFWKLGFDPGRVLSLLFACQGSQAISLAFIGSQ